MKYELTDAEYEIVQYLEELVSDRARAMCSKSGARGPDALNVAFDYQRNLLIKALDKLMDAEKAK